MSVLIKYNNIYNLNTFSWFMPAQDTAQIKDKIISTLKIRGPSLPVHVATETNLSMLFTSVFLSELFSEKRIKMSNMKVGSSSIYFIPGHEPLLEKFSEHLKSKERDAFMLLRERKFLKDTEQEPAIRVALRQVKDFAIPFNKDNEVIWRYFKVNESEYAEEPKKEIQIKEEIKPKTTPITKIQQTTIITKPIPKPQKETHKTITPKKTKKETIVKKQNDKFFNKVKEFLSKNSTEILDIEDFNKNEIILKVKNNEKEQFLIAYNKKRINESDIIKAHKKSLEVGLPYTILSLGEIPKKLDDFLGAIKSLEKIEKIE